jgi:putative phosphotransacetylase
MKPVLVETSARHIHVTQEALEILVGKGAKLEAKKPLSQPGQFVSSIRLDIVGPKKTISGVSILGPCRKACQVEVSATDARTLGSIAVIRESGDVAGTPAIKLVNPENGASIDLKEGLIVAKRHIHMTPADAQEFNVKNGDIVSVAIDSTERKLVFGDVVVRVSPSYAFAMHIDTDESNAAGCVGEVFGKIIK